MQNHHPCCGEDCAGCHCSWTLVRVVLFHEEVHEVVICLCRGEHVVLAEMEGSGTLLFLLLPSPILWIYYVYIALEDIFIEGQQARCKCTLQSTLVIFKIQGIPPFLDWVMSDGSTDSRGNKRFIVLQ